MRSNAGKPGQSGQSGIAAADVAAQLASAIDECAAAAHHSAGAAEPDFAGWLATIWAMLTAVDPELAACTARYARL